LLGRILGDVIREQEGVEAYELIEQIRKLVGRVPARCRPSRGQGAQKTAQGPEQ